MFFSHLRRFLPYRVPKFETFIIAIIIASLGWSVALPFQQARAQSQCTLGCKATVPQTALQNDTVPFTSEATAEGCAVAPAYEWTFGDGSPRESMPNTRHKFPLPGIYNWQLTSSTATIDTVAGGYGENAFAKQAPFTSPVGIALDPKGRGYYVVDSANGFLLRFVNTTRNEVTIGGQKIDAGAAQLLAGGGTVLEEYVTNNSTKGRLAELGRVTGMAASLDGDLLYLLNADTPSVRVLNVSSETKAVCSEMVDPGNIIRHSLLDLDLSPSGIAINPVNGDLYVASARPQGNKIYKISCGAVATVAGNSAQTRGEDPFSPGAALSTPLLLPNAIVFDPSGNLYIADTGHARVIKVDTTGQASLVIQFPYDPPQIYNPYPNGLAFANGNLYVALGNQQTIVRLTGQQAVVVGAAGRACDYASSNCGDGGDGIAAQLNLTGSTGAPGIAGIAGDANGLFIPDQGLTARGRVRYLNLSANPVTISDTMIAPGRIDTVAGNGLKSPYDSGLAISSSLATPTGVAIDANGNLFIADTLTARLRFVNRSAAAINLFEGTAAEQTIQPGRIATLNKDTGNNLTDGISVNFAGFDNPQGLKATSQGLFIADTKKGPSVPSLSRRTGLIRFLNTSSTVVTFYPNSLAPIIIPPGNIATIAGGSTDAASKGDGQFARIARFLGPADVAVHPATNDIYVASTGDKAVRKINATTGIVSSLPLPAAQYTGVAFDKQGRLHIVDFDNGVVLRETAAGSGQFARMNAERLDNPRAVVVDSTGNAYISEAHKLPYSESAAGNRIARISPDGQVSTVAGKYEAGFDGDRGPALGAQVNLRPSDVNIATVGTAVMLPMIAGLALSSDNELLFSDVQNNRIRRVAGLNNQCSQTGIITVTGDNPIPVLSKLTPTSARTNDKAFRLTVEGRSFVADSKVRWDGVDRPTTRLSDTKLEAEISAADLATARQINVTVFSPAPGGGASLPLVFTVKPAVNPVPVLQSVEPASVLAGSPAFTLTVRGEGFVADSVVRWNGLDMRTTFVSDKELTAAIAADLLTKSLSIPITVFTPTPNGGVSARLAFLIKPNSEPKLTKFDPTSLPANSLVAATFEITANGEQFVPTSSVLWNGVARQTRFISDKQLAFKINNDDVQKAGIAVVTVSNAESGGAVSAPLNFTITAAPEISLINPLAVRAGGAGFTLKISGKNFTQGAEAYIGGKARRTTVVNAIELQVMIEAEDIATPGTVNIVVLSGPNGQLPRGVSNAVSLQVVSPTGGNVASVSAASFASGPISPESIIAAFGSGFCSGTESATTLPLPTTLHGTRVIVKDSSSTERDAPLFFVSPTQINYLMPAGTANGIAIVTVISENQSVGNGIAEITKVVPSLFTANATGEGLVSGVALRVTATGAPSFEPILSYDQATQRFVATPIDLGVATEQVYLIFFGTGLRNRSALTAVKAQVGGEDITVSFAGAAPGLAGVDQLNLGPLPHSLAGRGTISTVVTVDGKQANTVQLAIK